MVELLPWMPAVAGSIGFSVGAAYLAYVVSPWFLFFLALPIALYRGFFALAFELIFFPGTPVELRVEQGELTLQVANETRTLPLDGIIQVFRDDNRSDWTLLHANRTSIAIPAELISAEQLDYLKGFALRAARERWAANPRE
jgi:hypothetical protein